MPSLAMHLAIAKKYLENHPEENMRENEEEFYQGAIAPDMTPLLELGNGRLHYGENSHRPGLNRFYQEEGLNSSYNRGYFLHLLTDYLFYNRFLNEYSTDICDDYRKMNKRIIETYTLDIPENAKPHIDIEDGELKVLDEKKVYDFIDTVSQLDLEGYKTQIKEVDKEHKIKLVGLKEGLLFKQNAPTLFNQHSETYLYGYENNYGVLIKRKIGFSETEGAREGLYQVTPIGIAVKPSKIMRFSGAYIAAIREELPDEINDQILKECEESIGKSISRDIDLNFEKIEIEDIKKILNIIRKLPERKPKKIVNKRALNSDLIEEKDIEIR